VGLTIEEAVIFVLGAALIARFLVRAGLPQARTRFVSAANRHSDELREEFVLLPPARIAAALLVSATVLAGAAMAAMERLAGELPPGFGVAWTGLSYEERLSGAQAPLLYALSILVVFLCLAAMYESWTIPTAVMLVVPLGILGTVLATTLRGMERDVYFQVAMLTTVGLSSKNAILIITFAKDNLARGMDLVDATMDAVRIRLRPILMTSLAFGLGVLPLAIATGAGSGAQRAIGTGVLGGMIAGTLLGVFFTPLFFVTVQRLFGRHRRAPATADGAA